MKHWGVWAAAFILFTGCTPKMGKDILIEPQGGIRLENTRDEVMLGVLWLLGAPVEKEAIRLGGDIKVVNRWHSDMKLVSLSYSLNDGPESIARGEACINDHTSWVIASGKEKIIPLSLRIDTERLSLNRINGVLQSKRKLFLKGEAVIEVWGFQKHYFFEKEGTKEIQKALKKLLSL